MDLPPEAIPPEAMITEALGRFLRSYGILIRALQALEGTPKPWPNSTKRARLLLAQAMGMHKDAALAIPSHVKAEAFRWTTTHPVVRNNARKSVGTGE